MFDATRSTRERVVLPLVDERPDQQLIVVVIESYEIGTKTTRRPEFLFCNNSKTRNGIAEFSERRYLMISQRVDGKVIRVSPHACAKWSGIQF